MTGKFFRLCEGETYEFLEIRDPGTGSCIADIEFSNGQWDGKVVVSFDMQDLIDFVKRATQYIEERKVD
jgi:hypothetical protein